MNRSDKGLIRLTLCGMALLGVIAACAAGLLLGWVVWPSSHYNAAPANLQPSHKEEYITLVAAAYAQDRDLEKAQARLEQLDAPNIKQWVAQVTDRYIAEGQDAADTRALVTLAQAMGVASPQMARLLPTSTRLPTSWASPMPPSPTPTSTLSPTPVPPSATPTQAPPTATLTPTVAPTDTPAPTATPTRIPATPKPRPTNTPPKPTNTLAPAWTWTARLMGPGEPSIGCTDANPILFVTVLNRKGVQLPDVWLREGYTGVELKTGEKAQSDPSRGIGEAEFVGAGGGKLCVLNAQGGQCVSGWTRDMPARSVPPVEDLYAAGYCEQCCGEPGLTLVRCQELVSQGRCMGFGHYSWKIVFTRNQ